MESIIVVINIILAIVLVVVVLLQRSEGGALGLGVSQDNFTSSRSVGTFLTKLTTIIASLFIICSIVLVAINRDEIRKTQSVLELEERHFGALAGQGLVNIQLKNYEKAIMSYEKAQKIYPSMKSPKIMIKEIKELIKQQSI